ncbi:nitrate/nitrite two-component system sensor histidine kinase NarQ [Vibrio sp. TH_r3]|uniref:nitrate/nitrite two-component system sensor histidine kinase NarQ n=1 Tax=Vibrio sp. TH_r3 TaxID=3082084 RepID=UPI0029542348|nr:nitrate/nitrite two-component system sensor histidine kinase NarQ [Vibrio sp. TH_r3]MDV7104824.1 nitrate/nitrite two-component system sensor histidine kinase NarQ [Vibrio sp. TH_r3]
MQRTYVSVTKTIARAMIIILFLSVVTTVITLYALYSNLDDAEAINIAGSLRMQSYRLAFDIETQSTLFHDHIVNYERSLNAPTLRAIENWLTPSSLVENYQLLLSRWQELQPALLSEDKFIYLDEVASYVNQIDIFVYELQEFSQLKLQILFITYGLVFIFILMVVSYVIYFSHRKIVKPLRKLMNASKEVQSGNFNCKVHIKSQNELGVLANAFNGMATELEKHYTGLEKTIAEKTHRLEHAKNSLEVLYGCQQELSSSHLGEQNFKTILSYLHATEGITAVRLVVEETHAEWELQVGKPDQSNWHSEPLKLDHDVMGRLEWQFTLPCPDKELITNVAKILSRGIYYNDTQKQTQQLLLMEERATIARELHDSIAQSLSYLKIQTTLLNRSIAKPDMGQAAITAQEIDKQLSATYTQLRELLSTFRLTIGKANLGEALQELLKPLEEQTSAEVILDNTLASISLRANHQVHVIQLIREAVLNAMKHANASMIKVNCHQQDRMVNISVVDNGNGFCTNIEKINHYGLTIMSERAERLNGDLKVISKPGEGCTIQLFFPLQM